MKLEFVGVSNGYAYDDQKLSGIVVDDKILLDCGITGLRREQYQTLESIFISHGHNDHICGLGPISLGLEVEKTKIRENGIEGLEFPIYGPKGIRKKVSENIEAQFRPYAKLNELNAFDEFDFKEYKVKTFPIKHSSSFVSLAYKFEKDGKSFVYTGDTSFDKNPQYRTEVLVHEATFTDAYKEIAKDWNHTTARQAGKVAKTIGAETLVLTLLASELRKANGSFLKEAQEEFDGKIILAHEGLILDI